MRGKAINSRYAFVSLWAHTESGLTYDTDRPILAFVEEGVRIDALYHNLDENHIVRFNPLTIYDDLNFSRNKIQMFREECYHYQSKKLLSSAIGFATKACAAIGIYLFSNTY
jgi:hypothetical protein